MFKNFLTTNVEVSKSEQREFTKYKYPASFDEKVDLSKVNEAIMETWVGKKVSYKNTNCTTKVNHINNF